MPRLSKQDLLPLDPLRRPQKAAPEDEAETVSMSDLWKGEHKFKSNLHIFGMDLSVLIINVNFEIRWLG